MARADGPFGDVLGLPFDFEGVSFFVAAIFLGIYLYGWDRMPPHRHLTMLVPIGGAGVFGTFCLVSVNAWMDNPTWFRVVGGQVTDVNPWRAMFNDGVWLQFAHLWVSAFMRLGSLIAKNSFTKRCRAGTPSVADRPPSNVTHLGFQSLVGIGTLLALVVFAFWVLRCQFRPPRDMCQMVRWSEPEG